METLGYNVSSNYFKESEMDKEGMIRLLGLNEMAVEQIIEDRVLKIRE